MPYIISVGVPIKSSGMCLSFLLQIEDCQTASVCRWAMQHSSKRAGWNQLWIVEYRITIFFLQLGFVSDMTHSHICFILSRHHRCLCGCIGFMGRLWFVAPRNISSFLSLTVCSNTSHFFVLDCQTRRRVFTRKELVITNYFGSLVLVFFSLRELRKRKALKYQQKAELFIFLKSSCKWQASRSSVSARRSATATMFPRKNIPYNVNSQEIDVQLHPSYILHILVRGIIC